jgi:hypothetical protein
MLKVNIILENDDILNNEFQTLSKAIEVSKSGDNISVSPGSYEPIQINSKITPFELKIEGSGMNTICSQFIFDGFFDFTFQNLKIENINMTTSSSNFNFYDVKFITMNKIILNSYKDILGEDPRTTIIFEKCRFGNNFQIELLSGSYVISFKSCEFKGIIPTIYAKKGEINVKISNTDFEESFLYNKNAIVEIQHTSCNFNCPIYKGKECLVYTKDNICGSTTPLISNLFLFNEKKEKENSEIKEEKEWDHEKKELYGAITINSEDYNNLKLHEYTKFVKILGCSPVNIFLPKSASNGHLIEIYTEAVIFIDDQEYHNRIIKIRWIYGDGWFFY